MSPFRSHRSYPLDVHEVGRRLEDWIARNEEYDVSRNRIPYDESDTPCPAQFETAMTSPKPEDIQLRAIANVRHTVGILLVLLIILRQSQLFRTGNNLLISLQKTFFSN